MDAVLSSLRIATYASASPDGVLDTISGVRAALRVCAWCEQGFGLERTSAALREL